MPHTDGRIYETANARISTRDVMECLGLSTDSCKVMCLGGNALSPRSGVINQMSFCKPFSAPLLRRADASSRRSWNYGWSNFRGSLGERLYDVLNAKGAGEKWVWEYPRGGMDSSPYRMLDFDGYDHNSDEPFFMAFDQAEYGLSQAAHMIVSDLNELRDHFAEWEISERPEDPNWLGLGVAFATSANKTNWTAQDHWCMMCGYNVVNAWSDMDGERVPSVPAAYLSELGVGTWYAYPFIIDDTRAIVPDISSRKVTGMDLTGAIMMYQAPIEVRIVQHSPQSSFEFVLSGECTGDGVSYSQLQLNLQCVISGLTGTADYVYADFYIDAAGLGPGQSQTVSLGSASVQNAGDGTYVLTEAYSGTVWPLIYDPKGDGTAAVRAEVTVRVGGDVFSRTIMGKIYIQ